MRHLSPSSWFFIDAAATLTFAARSTAAQGVTPEARQVLPRVAVPRNADSNPPQAPAAASVDANAQRARNAGAPAASTLPADHPMARSAFRAASSSPFAGTTVQQGSSVSHYDTSARRNLLMEPRLNDGLTTELQAPNDLTYELFLDIGW